MRIMLDTNVLFSAIIFQSTKLNQVIEKAINDHTLVICSYVIDELYRVVKRKKPNLESAVDRFLFRLSFEQVYSPKVLEGEKLYAIRDENDYLILYTAIVENIDILITGDKDFADVKVDRPEILTPAQFLEKY